MKRWLCTLVLASSSVAFADGPASADPADAVDDRPIDAVQPPAAIAHWTDAHPAATFALVDWIQKSPESARLFFWWDRSHPLRAQAFLRWLIDNPAQPVDAFESAHAGWPAIDLVLKPNRDALDGLVAWVRAHPAAVQDLASTPRGFAWVGFHPLHHLWAPAEPAADSSAQ